MSDNELEELPEWIGELTNLRVYVVSDAQPPCLTPSASLGLSNNPLAHAPLLKMDTGGVLAYLRETAAEMEERERQEGGEPQTTWRRRE